MLLQDMQQSPYYLQLKRKEKLAIPAVPRFSDRARKLASSTKRPMLGSLGLDANFFPPELQPVVDPSLRSTVQAGRKRKRRAMADAAELALAMGEISDDDDAVAKPRGGNADGSDDEEADPMDQDDDWEDDEDGDDDYNAEKYYDEDRDDDAEEGRGGGTPFIFIFFPFSLTRFVTTGDDF
ncbi:DNA-directed RNA polymerase III, subunit Rpc31 [Blastocladiella britannica]|nr:DNA-directed RNA polymerase III, subunit Rpc31 [Blastocladiella britannica]